MSRDSFLQHVRQAVQTGNQAGARAEVPARGDVGYQGAGPDPVARFRDELTTAGGRAYLVVDDAAAVDAVREIIRAKAVRRILLENGTVLDRLNLANRLQADGVEVVSISGLTADASRPAFFDAELGINGVDFLVAESGSIALLSRPGEPRSTSLLPPVHVAVADRTQLLPDLFDLFAKLDGSDLPSCLSLITGPSKTGDIELRLVTGVHGPGEVHVILITG